MSPSDQGTADTLVSSVKTVSYRKGGADQARGRVSVRTLKEMIARWELGPDDFIRIDGDATERRVKEYPALSPLDEMLADASEKVSALRRGIGRRSDVVRRLEVLREYAEYNDRVYAVASFLLGWLRYAENPALSRGLFLKALERGYPFTSIARNNLAVAEIRLGDAAGRENLILAAKDPQRTPAAIMNLARLLQHLQALGENTDEIANTKDLMKVARAEWRKAPPAPGDPASFALFLCDGDIPASFFSESRSLAKAQGQIEDILAEGEDCLRHGRIEQAMANAARAAAETDRAREELSRSPGQKGASPLSYLSARLSRLLKGAVAAREARDAKGQLELFRRRLRALEESLALKVPPADLIQQAEILLDSAHTDGERSEASNLLAQCQERVASHLLETASELLAAGEKEVAVGLLRRALTLGSRETDEIKLRLANIQRDELVESITRCLGARSFEEARIRIARLRTIHPIFEPVAGRLEAEVRSQEAGMLLDQIVTLCGTGSPEKETVVQARALFEKARSLSPEPEVLVPVEEELHALEVRSGLRKAEDAAARKPAKRSRPGFALEPEPAGGATPGASTKVDP